MLIDSKPIEVRFLREEKDRSVIVPSIDKARECTEKNGKKIENFTLIPAYIKLYTENHPVACVALFGFTDDDEKEYTDYVMGYSICGEGDSFSYEKAKEIAFTRAEARYSEITDYAQMILPKDEDIQKFPSHLREDFVRICTELFVKYGI